MGVTEKIRQIQEEITRRAAEQKAREDECIAKVASEREAKERFIIQKSKSFLMQNTKIYEAFDEIKKDLLCEIRHHPEIHEYVSSTNKKSVFMVRLEWSDPPYAAFITASVDPYKEKLIIAGKNDFMFNYKEATDTDAIESAITSAFLNPFEYLPHSVAVDGGDIGGGR